MTTDKATNLDSPAATQTHVAELLPPTAPAPQPARRINFIKALLFFWLIPKRFGPHLTMAPWWRALAAHGIAAVFSFLVVVYLSFAEMSDGPVSLYTLRESAAEVVLNLATSSASLGFSPMLALSLVPILEFAILALAIIMMPWSAGGDRALSVLKRSLKNVYWSTTYFIPVAIIILAIDVVDPDIENWIDRNLAFILIPLFAVAIAFIWYIRILVLGASVYVGEPDGPAFSPREPLCDDCGYRLTGLPFENNCPECGTPVSESLSGGRRQRNAWHIYQFRPRGFVELIRMQWRIIRGNDIFKHLPVQEGLSTARHFWWGIFLLIILAVLLSTALSAMALHSSMTYLEWRITRHAERAFIQFGPIMALCAVTVPFLLQTALMFIACLHAQYRLKMRDYRVSAIVCYYASPLMWPFILIAWAGGFLWLCGEVGVFGPATHFHVRIFGIRMNTSLIGCLIWMVMMFAALAFWMLRLSKALRTVRYANV